jgi:hypothetical protein
VSEPPELTHERPEQQSPTARHGWPLEVHGFVPLAMPAAHVPSLWQFALQHSKMDVHAPPPCTH